MGEAKHRKPEIEVLKRMTPKQSAQWRDQMSITEGINPRSEVREHVASMARVLSKMLQEAKLTGNVDPPVTFLYATVNATIRGLADIPVACKKGCSHCCHTWVSASAPEVLFTAKLVKLHGNVTIEKVRATNEHTKGYDFDTRDQHPYPCPLLEQDICSVYDSRPMTCRLAASANADICARTYHNLTNEEVPIPIVHLMSRSAYSIAIASGLRKAGLPHDAYEWNAALTHALETEDAERRWLSGENIFRDVLRQAEDIFADQQVEQMYEYTFS